MIRFCYSLWMAACLCHLHAQNTYEGVIMNDQREGLIGVHVFLDDLTTVTGVDGDFSFEGLDEGEHNLSIRTVGYEDLTRQVNIGPGQFPSPVEIILKEKVYIFDPIELTGSWIKKDQPFTHSNIQKDKIEQNNAGQDVPYLLRWTPSTVVTSDAGTGIGYTGIRIRGSDPSRINVTIDGIPVNDSESQGVFWVDLPDLASSASEIQIQRGVGTSTNGAGAFGGTINVKSERYNAEPSAVVDLSGGSFNTQRGSVQFGSGLLYDHFTFEGRLSSIESDGYIDRGSADLTSYYLAGTYLDDNQSLKIKLFSGKEVTYQAWNGVPAQYIDDPDLRTYNTAGIRADGTFHPNEVDDYTQTHLHAIYNRSFDQGLVGQLGFHYTKGFGFFEQYRIEDPLQDYMIDPVMIGGEVIETSDLIRRRWLDNDFYGVIFSLGNEANDQELEWKIGGGYNLYEGDHFGEVIWARFMGDVEQGHEYYRNDAVKKDLNIYGQVHYNLGSSTRLFADLQWRNVDYRFLGFNQELQPADQEIKLNFFNPKVGLTHEFGSWEAYYSFAVGNREPNRDDYVNSSPSSRPDAESLYDNELGIGYQSGTISGSANLYFMYYRDQLILTGEINDVGEYIRTNVASSYRAGIEINAAWKPDDRWLINGGATFSDNRIREFDEAIDNWDTGEQQIVAHENVPIAFSPSVIAQASIQYALISSDLWNLEVEWLQKYIGKQYLDNTGSAFTQLDPYYVSDLHFRLGWTPDWCERLDFKVMLQNLFDLDIITNGWTYRYISEGYDARPDDPHARLEEGSTYNLTGFYPQAGRNFLAGVTLTF